MKDVLKSIVIRGGYGYGNFGDDALMAAVHTIATQLCSARDVAYLCRGASYLHTLLPDAEILRLRDRDRLSVRMLLFGGGTQFYSFPPTTGHCRAVVTRAIRLLRRPHLLPLKAAQRILPRHTKEHPDHVDNVTAVGVGVGPFAAGSCVQTRTRELFANMAYVSVRDARSYELCRQWGVTNLYHHTDLCFWPGFQAASIPDVIHETDCRVGRVGVIVRDWRYDTEGDSYHKSLLAVADRLSRAGKTVHFILFAGRYDRVCLERLKATRFNVVLWNPRIDSIRVFVRTLASYDLFITARYHGAVFATLLGKPSICIEVEPKLRLFAEVLGAGGRCWSHPFDEPECLRMVEEIEADYPHVAAHVRNVKHHQSIVAAQMVDGFLEFARHSMGMDNPTPRERTGTEITSVKRHSNESPVHPLLVRSS